MPGQTRPDESSLPDAGVLLGQIEEERHQIARELHDECGQILAASLFKLDAHLAGLPDDSAKAASDVRDIRATLLTAVRDVRSLVYRLHPPMLAEWGLVATMRWQIQQFMTQYGIATTYDGPDGVQLPAAMEMAVFRIVQEALTNIAKYSKARTVEVQLAADRYWLTVHVVDDGLGFDPKHASE
jgi:signal transduction histidine kinase